VIQDQPRAVAPTAPTETGAAPLGVFILVIVVAVFLRFWNLGSAGISHWDAGTYTAGPLAVGPYGRGESVLFQTPPLVPSMFKALFDLWSPVDTIAIGAIAILGVATIVALFLAGRRWVGDTAAIAGTAALAGMHYHLLYSRQALTDVPFAFFLLLAAWAFTAAFDRGSLVFSLVAGATAGATILTKYHGPLALVLPAVWLCVWRIRRSPRIAPESRGAQDVPSRRAWGLWLVACGVAAVPAVWLAWEIHRTIGLSTFRESRREWLSSPGLYLVPLTARLVGRSLWEWVSPFALAPALLGFLVMLRRRSSGDLLLLVWTAQPAKALKEFRIAIADEPRPWGSKEPTHGLGMTTKSCRFLPGRVTSARWKITTQLPHFSARYPHRRASYR
jgi:4-amino-4-deoxy-L-arabinose transferase-like glycosyltransferase